MHVPRFFLRIVMPVLLLCGIWAGALCISPEGVSAADFRTRDTTVSEEEFVDDDLFLSGDEIEMAGTVTGDLVVIGNMITISGDVEGDVYAFGGEVVVSGEVGRSLFTASGRVRITGIVNRSLYVTGGQILVAGESYVMEDVIGAGGQVDIDGWIGDDLLITGGNVAIESMVTDDLYASGGMVRAEEENVGGDFNVTTGEGRGVNIRVGDWFDGFGLRDVVRDSAAVAVVLKLLWFAGMYLIGLVFILLFPVKTRDIINKTMADSGEFLLSMLLGLVISAALPVVVLFLLVTVVGTPLAVLLTGVALFLAFFGPLWFDMAVGRLIARVFGYTEDELYIPLFLGRVVRLFLSVIPCIGALYSLITLWAVFGAVFRMKLGRVQAAGSMTVKVQETSMTEGLRTKPEGRGSTANAQRRGGRKSR